MARKAASLSRRRLLIVGFGLATALGVAGAIAATRGWLGTHKTASGLAIRVQGNALVDGNGIVVRLHGANLSGTEFMCVANGTGAGIYGGPADLPSTYAAMRAWNINAVRVPLNEDCWLGIHGINPAYSGANYQAAIATEVQTINAAGMYVLLDLHWSGGGSNLANGQAVMADADHSPAFWASVAGTFKSYPAVIFDVFNEPHPHDAEYDPTGSDPWGWRCWSHGCAIHTGDTSAPSPNWQATGMQDLVNAVRGSGATNPVLVNGNSWGNDATGWLASGLVDPAGQLVAGLHSYPTQGCVLPSCWALLKPLAASVPLVIGETGDSATGPVTYMNKELPAADNFGLSYLAWTWNPWQNPDDVLIRDWLGTPTSGEGAYYRAHLLQTFGVPAPTPAAAAPTGKAPMSSSTAAATPLAHVAINNSRRVRRTPQTVASTIGEALHAHHQKV
jgi:endoglucanase